MATMTLSKRELPELEFPLDYPACLDRIVKAAENRADYEIAISFFERMLTENDVLGNHAYSIGEIFGLGTGITKSARKLFSEQKYSYRPPFGKK